MVKRDAHEQARLKVRTRAQRWTELRDLLSRVDALMAMNVHIDLLTENKRDVVEEAAQFEKDRERVSRAVQREVNALTADALNADLRHKQVTRDKAS